MLKCWYSAFQHNKFHSKPDFCLLGITPSWFSCLNVVFLYNLISQFCPNVVHMHHNVAHSYTPHCYCCLYTAGVSQFWHPAIGSLMCSSSRTSAASFHLPLDVFTHHWSSHMASSSKLTCNEALPYFFSVFSSHIRRVQAILHRKRCSAQYHEPIGWWQQRLWQQRKSLSGLINLFDRGKDVCS